jgi:4-amino-4-deoxy-L-arabinose transferase-like glycosyltransferase
MDVVQQANQNSDGYILTTVLCALVLFFAGIAGKWRWPMLSLICLGIAMIFLVIVLYRIFTLPVIIH